MLEVRCDGVGFFTKNDIPAKTVDSSMYSTFENIFYQLSLNSLIQSHLLLSIVHQVHVPLPFLMISCFFFCGLLSSLSSSFIIGGVLNVHVDTDCIEKRKFLNLLDSYNLVKSVNKPIHLRGHILDLMLSPTYSALVSNVTVGDLVSDRALVKCQLDFACPVTPKVDRIFNSRYHKINMQGFRDDLASTSFAKSPASTAADRYTSINYKTCEFVFG